MNTHPHDVVLVHSSDLHIDDVILPGGYDGLVGLRAVLATAHALSADLVLLAGDTFDNHRVSLPVLRQAAALLANAAMPVVMLPGNHDSIMPDCLFRRAGLVGVPGLHILGVSDAERLVFEAHALEILGLAHRGFGDMAPLHPPDARGMRRRIVLAHGHYVPPDEAEAQEHRAWRITDSDLASTDADYVALGHWDRATPAGDGSVQAHYSGSPDLAGTINLVHLRATGEVTVRREALIWPSSVDRVDLST